MTNRKAGKAMQALSAKTDAVRANAADLLQQLEDQVQKLNRMAEENLEQGMLGHYAEAIKMRDSAKETLEGLRQKLGLGVSVAPKETKLKTTEAKELKEEQEAKQAKAAQKTSGTQEAEGKQAGTRLAHESKAGHVVSTDAKSNTSEEKAPCYRWDPRDTDEVPDVELSDSAVRCSWPNSGWLLRLPVAFSMDLERCKVLRRRRRRLLELHLSVQPGQPPRSSLLEAVPRQGFGWMDGFLAGPEADAVRARVLELWKSGELNEGEVEGGNKQHLRSDRYLFMEEDDPAVSPFTRRLDQLVLSIAKEAWATPRDCRFLRWRATRGG
eukprot:symbB.v1.2.025310.t1/scaffold2450.1/size78879/6